MTAAEVAGRRGFSLGQIFAATVATVVLSSLVVRFILTTSTLGFVPGAVRFFSFFTILSNILVAIVVTPAAFWPGSFLARRVTRLVFASAVALYIVITGLIFHILLSGLETLTGLDEVCNIGLHYVTPVLYTIFWALFVAKGQLRPIHVLWWLIYPIGYAAFSLARGPIVNWYPYPFIDASVHSVGQLAFNILGVTAAFVVIGLLFVGVDRLIGGLGLRRAPVA